MDLPACYSQLGTPDRRFRDVFDSEIVTLLNARREGGVGKKLGFFFVFFVFFDCVVRAHPNKLAYSSTCMHMKLVRRVSYK